MSSLNSKSESYDNILFDGGDLFILKYYENCKKYHSNNFNEYNKLEILDTEIKNKQFFTIISTIPIYNNSTQISRSSISYMFNSYIVDIFIEKSSYCSGELQFGQIQINIIKHNIPKQLLFAIKYFQYDNHNKTFINKIDIYNTHPEYFMSNIEKNISHSLQGIQKEKEEIMIDNQNINNEKKLIESKNKELDKLMVENKTLIKEKQTELDKLILENHQKIDYYKSLEQQIIDVNKEKDIIKEEKERLQLLKKKCHNKKEILMKKNLSLN
jgi:hypothetical protein